MKQLNAYIPYDPAITLLCIYSTEMHAYVYLNRCTRKFKPALFVIAKNWMEKIQI